MNFLKRAWVEIDINALKNNYRTICSRCDAEVIPVIKADAYGHGAIEIAGALKECGANFFAVSNILEALELREHGVDGDILVLGYTPVDAVSMLLENNITQCVYSYEYAQILSDEAKRLNGRIKAHLKLDTGMGRIGFNCREDVADIDEIASALELDGIEFCGVFTHFTVADSKEKNDVDYTLSQYNRFKKTLAELEKSGFTFKIKHCCNSAGLWVYNDMCIDAVRAGIVLYGLSPSPDVSVDKALEPVMSFYTVVTMVKEIENGDTVSYGRTYTAQNNRRIATVAAGYADGVPRLLSNKGTVLINGKEAPIVGRVCMDQFCIDVTDIDNVSIGDKVEIFGKNISVDRVAENAQTINYEIICGISKRVPRIIKESL